jgi:hypothetical protein
MKDLIPVVFGLMTGLFWGTYGPALAESRKFLGNSPFKPYVAIGLAYLVWGIGGGLIGMWYKKDSWDFTGQGMVWGLIAGTLGAWGALTLTLAMFNGGKPVVVMPIVFGSAVTVSALVSLWKEWEHTKPSTPLILGIVGIVVCAIIVAKNTPHAAPAKKPGETAQATQPGNTPQKPHS